jgi:CRP-like cAMP-binding protein
VAPATWIHLHHQESWHRARDLDELRMFFQARKTEAAGPAQIRPVAGSSGDLVVRPGSLRRIKILAGLSDDQIERFIQLMEVQRVAQWTEITRQGQPGDAMYLILEGEVRVRLMIAGKESILATLSEGEFFGEVALFDQGPRSADVVANKNCLLLRISASAFHQLVTEAADLAAPFLFAMGKTLIARIRADNRRYRDSIVFARTTGT